MTINRICLCSCSGICRFNAWQASNLSLEGFLAVRHYSRMYLSDRTNTYGAEERESNRVWQDTLLHIGMLNVELGRFFNGGKGVFAWGFECHKESCQTLFQGAFIFPGTIVCPDNCTTAIRPAAKDALSGTLLSLADFGAGWTNWPNTLRFTYKTFFRYLVDGKVIYFL